MKKRFDCGHFANGKYCHRCALATQLGLVLEGKLTVPRYLLDASKKEIEAEQKRLREVKQKPVVGTLGPT